MKHKPSQFEFCVTSLSTHNENASVVFFFIQSFCEKYLSK